MITKERLKELIEQGATIYSTHWKEEVDLSLPCKIVDRVINSVLTEVLIVDEGKGFTPNYLLSNLTEDVEGAKWAEEFGCIERTERLELPTWEDLQKEFIFKAKSGKIIYLTHDEKTIFLEDEDWNILRLPLTQENYTKACRKCKELFLGGKDE